MGLDIVGRRLVSEDETYKPWNHAFNTLVYKIIAYVYRDAFCSQHFEDGSNYGHLFSVSRPLVHMRFPVSRPLIHMRNTH